jgi:hypothetical protein
MDVVYSLSTGNQVRIYLWEDLFQGKTYRKYVEVQRIVDSRPAGKEFFAKVFSDADSKLFFVCDREKVFIQSFNFLTVEEMLKEFQSGKRLDRNQLWATFIKDTQNVGLVHDGKTYVPRETSCYPKALWYHKIRIVGVTDSYDEMSRDYYFDDLCQHINHGVFQLVKLSTLATSSN